VREDTEDEGGKKNVGFAVGKTSCKRLVDTLVFVSHSNNNSLDP
jgi:hypothetical protein